MRILVVDRCGRGHCLACMLARTPGTEVHYVPGCSGLSEHGLRTAQHLSIADPQELIAYARLQRIELVIVANAVALVNGVADAFREAGFRTVGPSRQAAQLEGSKVFAKSMFRKYGIPTPEHQAFDDPAQADRFVDENPDFRVVKADGLCGGNGSFVCDTSGEARRAIDLLMRKRIFGASGDRVVIEKRLYGRELSFFAILDAGGWRTLPMAADYPKTDDGNRGPISGGMGSISHHPMDTLVQRAAIEQALLKPLHGLIRSEALGYTGFIFLGVMVSPEGDPFLLETNVRMGEPEAEVILPRLRCDLVDVFHATLEGGVAQREVAVTDEHLCNVVAVQGSVRTCRDTDQPRVIPGWPVGEIATGQVISGLERVDRDKCHLFMGEARQRQDGRFVSDGGRVVHVVGRGVSLEEARNNAYDQIGCVRFEGMRYRHDIGAVMPWEDLGAIPRS